MVHASFFPANIGRFSPIDGPDGDLGLRRESKRRKSVDSQQFPAGDESPGFVFAHGQRANFELDFNVSRNFGWHIKFYVDGHDNNAFRFHPRHNAIGAGRHTLQCDGLQPY